MVICINGPLFLSTDALHKPTELRSHQTLPRRPERIYENKPFNNSHSYLQHVHAITLI